MWSRQRVLRPTVKSWWMASHAGSAFCTWQGSEATILVSGRGADNRSRIGVARGKIDSGNFSIGQIDANPILDVGTHESFYRDGVSYPWLFEIDGRQALLFTGWIRRGDSFLNQLGIAYRSDDEEPWTVSPRPLFPDHGQGTGSACYWASPDGPLLAVTSFTGWRRHRAKQIPTYEIRWAHLRRQGVWELGERVSGLGQASDNAVARPAITQVDGHVIGMCSVRKGNTYSIEGGLWNGASFTDHRVLHFEPAGDGWESGSVEYAHLSQADDSVVVMYNGNGFGQTGLGAAVCAKRNFLEAVGVDGPH